MVLFPDNLLHISFQMLLQQVPVSLLLQKASEEFIHIVEHVLQRLVQSPGVDQSRLQQ